MKDEITNLIDKNFCLVDDLQKEIPTQKISDSHLCIIKSDINNDSIEKIKKLSKTYCKTEFWIATNRYNREQALLIHDCGVKNVILNPINMDLVREFFVQKQTDYAKNIVKNDTSIKPLPGLNVMIVDDNMFNLELLEHLLSEFDINLCSFSKPEKALFEVENTHYDMFILDIMMPRISGFDIAEKIKKSPKNSASPIVFISALTGSENQHAAFSLGSCAYIEKPFKINLVKKQIYNILKNQYIHNSINSAKESFFAMTCHDLKTPINAEIKALEYILKDSDIKKLSGNQPEILEEVLNSSKYMKIITDNLNCKYKFESGKLTLVKDNFELKDVAQECLNELKFLAANKNHTFALICKPEDTEIYADSIEIKRVLINLLSNACEYAEIDTEITVTIEKNESFYNLYIHNYGKKINLDNPNDIFEKYLSLAKEQKKIGTGLGLYITKQIITAHNGSISVESNNNGTTFKITLPINHTNV